eukprot:2222440-Pyramimonas_sp.AAC.1
MYEAMWCRHAADLADQRGQRPLRQRLSTPLTYLMGMDPAALADGTIKVLANRDPRETGADSTTAAESPAATWLNRTGEAADAPPAGSHGPERDAAPGRPSRADPHAPGADGASDPPAEGLGPSNQTGSTEGELEAPDRDEDAKSESYTAKDTSPADSPTPVADEGEEEGPSDPLHVFKNTPTRPNAWAPHSQTVDRAATREVRRARDSPEREISSTWDIM